MVGMMVDNLADKMAVQKVLMSVEELVVSRGDLMVELLADMSVDQMVV